MQPDTVAGSNPAQGSVHRVPVRLARLMAVGAALLAVVHLSPVRMGVVVGGSMEPALKPGQLFLYDRHPPRPGTLRAGDLVLVHLRGETCLKRVFALGGERFWAICARGPRPTILTPLRGRASMERWRKRFPALVFRESRVPRGMLFVMGDNVTSYDSRQLGPVPMTEVEGRVVAADVAPHPPGSLGEIEPPDRPRRFTR